MKHFKIYEDYNNINDICHEYHINNYVINRDGTIDVQGNVYFNNQNLKEIPLNFRKVSGNFYLYNNKLRSLKGSPRECYTFICNANNLRTLKFSPQKIHGSFECGFNNLDTLVEGPSDVSSNYRFEYNKIFDLKGFPTNFSFENEIHFNINPIEEIINLVKKGDQSKFIKFLIQFEVVNNNFINEEKLKQSYYATTKIKLVRIKYKFQNYTLK